MSNILALARRDAQKVLGNVIALVVCVGMVVVPSFYAWFNIWGSWDPYGNTANLRVALVNDDAGYDSDLLPMDVNLGDEVVDDLRETKSIGYVVTDRDDAVEGVRSGYYYAAVVIPQDFSARMITAFSDPDQRPNVEFYQNEKENAVASIVTDKFSTAVQNSIDRSFASTLVTVAAGTLDQLGDYLDGDDMARVAARLDQDLASAQARLRDTASNLRSYQAVVSSATDLVDSTSGSAGTSLSSALDASGMLRQTAGGIRDVGTSLDGTTDALNDALQGSGAQIDQVRQSVDGAFDTADATTDDLVAALGQARDVVDDQADVLQRVADNLDGTDQVTLLDRARNFEHQFPDQTSVDYQRAHKVTLEVQGLNDAVQNALASTRSLSGELQQTADDLSDAKADTASSRQEIDQLIDQARGSITAVQSQYEQGLRGSLDDLATTVDRAADDADAINDQLTGALASVTDTTSGVSADLGGLDDSLGQAADTLDGAADRLGSIQGQLEAALSSGDLDQVRTILSANATDLASFVATPVTVDRTAVFGVANNGSAMAPFYTVLAIWIGGVVLCALVKTAPSEAAVRELGLTPSQAYVGRIIFFLVIGFLQSTLVLVGDLVYLDIQCLHPWLFLLTGWLASFVFVNIVYALTASFGDVGKAIAVVLMVIQVAGSGGTFPKEMLPGIFQRLYPFLPFVHAEDAMRACIAGIYQNDYWFCMLRLAAFVVPALLLGLVLRRPVIRVNHWFERNLESTKVM